MLEHEYFINSVKVVYADISHEQPALVEEANGSLIIYLARNAKSILQLKAVYIYLFVFIGKDASKE